MVPSGFEIRDSGWQQSYPIISWDTIEFATSVALPVERGGGLLTKAVSDNTSLTCGTADPVRSETTAAARFLDEWIERDYVALG